MNQQKFYAQNDSGGKIFEQEDENLNAVERFGIYPE
jgi:hypothetical protein